MTQNVSLKWHAIPSMPFDENSYVAWLGASTDCFVVDPGLEPGKIIDFLEQRRLVPRAILITHGHSDHIAGNAALKQRWPGCQLIIGRLEEAKLSDPVQNLSAPFGLRITSPPADQLADDGDVVEVAGCRLQVRHTPGHSTGHVVYIWGEPPQIVFAGDVLFQASIGRTDFPDGSFPQLRDAIHQKLFTLPDDVLVLPGHGPPTQIGHEKRTNPFVALE